MKSKLFNLDRFQTDTGAIINNLRLFMGCGWGDYRVVGGLGAGQGGTVRWEEEQRGVLGRTKQIQEWYSLYSEAWRGGRWGVALCKGGFGLTIRLGFGNAKENSWWIQAGFKISQCILPIACESCDLEQMVYTSETDYSWSLVWDQWVCLEGAARYMCLLWGLAVRGKASGQGTCMWTDSPLFFSPPWSPLGSHYKKITKKKKQGTEQRSFSL